MTGPSDAPRTFVRFSPIRRCEHFLVILCFGMLAVTGLPQKFHAQGVSLFLVDLFGGICRLRTVHRFFGLLFAGQFALHIVHGLWTVWIRRRVPVIAPTMKDVRDSVQAFRYALCLAENEPRCGRFEFKQKYEYWGVIIGGLVMISTGFLLWKPVMLSDVFSAELIPISRVAHSNEALLAFLVILFWHLYSVTLNPEVFPLDTSIFTGRISEEHMKHTHPLEYEALPAAEDKPLPEEGPGKETESG